jgi:hypothetical protein
MAGNAVESDANTLAKGVNASSREPDFWRRWSIRIRIRLPRRERKAAEDGSIVWYRNVGRAKEPKLKAARLVGKSPAEWGGDNKRGPRDWGLRVKPCVFDWDGPQARGKEKGWAVDV